MPILRPKYIDLRLAGPAATEPCFCQDVYEFWLGVLEPSGISASLVFVCHHKERVGDDTILRRANLLLHLSSTAGIMEASKSELT